ncbi:MAG: hypothetical protein ABFR50_11660, partial [Candidatus Fermentibacteria bacterium]
MSSKIRLLYNIKAASLRGAAVSEWQTNRLKLIAGAITIAVLVPGIFILFRFLFSYIYGLEETFAGFGTALAIRLLAMTFMSFGVFIGISSFISGVSVVFRSWETSFLLAMPIKDELTAFYRMLESWFNAGWATILLGIPIVAAFCISLEVSTAGTVISMLLFPFLIAIWLSSGTVLLGAVIRLNRHNGRLWKTAGILGLVIAAGIFVLLGSSGPEGMIAEENSALDTVQRFVAELPVISGGFWPHTIFTNTISSIDSGLWPEALGHIGRLLIEAVLASLLASVMICPGFRRSYGKVSSASSRRRSSRLFFRSGGRFGAMLQKDILLFLRDPVQWSQLLL